METVKRNSEELTKSGARSRRFPPFVIVTIFNKDLAKWLIIKTLFYLSCQSPRCNCVTAALT